jgi:uncharacterized protein
MFSEIQHYFWGPLLVALLGLMVVWYLAGPAALFVVLVLVILEITLSFDNAVVNARVLARMNPLWQKRFLSWGILLAVFGSRLVLPILIVSVAVAVSPSTITYIALYDHETYGLLIDSVEGTIYAFGGTFLLMVALTYFFNLKQPATLPRKPKRGFLKWGKAEVPEIMIALTLLTGLSYSSSFDQASILLAGFIGVLLFVLIESIGSALSYGGNLTAKSGLVLFIYLNVLDAAFSLDGVIGAFALSSNILIIVTGLGIGAYFVRALTVYMVTKNTLLHLVYLERGAYWAILGLATSMLLNLIVSIPEIITGLVGLVCIGFAYYASLRKMRVGT